MKLFLFIFLSIWSQLYAAIEFDYSISKNDKETILNDFEVLKGLNFSKSPKIKYRRVFETDDANYSQIYNWLDTRINFLIGDKSNQFYRNSLNDSASSLVRISRNLHSSEIAYNYGSILYNYSKEYNSILNFRFQDNENAHRIIPIDKLRTGIIHVLPSFFSIDFKSENHSSSFTNSIFRLSTLIHEARHSDGHGDNTGFPHISCPPGHTYQGKPACDFSKNGPYSTSAEFLSYVIKDCSDCSEVSKATLELLMLDNLDRSIQKEKYVNFTSNLELVDIRLKIEKLEIEYSQMSLINTIQNKNMITKFKKMNQVSNEIKELNEKFYALADELDLIHFKRSKYENTLPPEDIK